MIVDLSEALGAERLCGKTLGRRRDLRCEQVAGHEGLHGRVRDGLGLWWP